MAAANKHWRREMLAYFCFTLPGALFPIGCLYVARVDQGYPFRIVDVAAESTILAIAIGLYMDAVSTLFKSGPKWFEIKIHACGVRRHRNDERIVLLRPTVHAWHD